MGRLEGENQNALGGIWQEILSRKGMPASWIPIRLSGHLIRCMLPSRPPMRELSKANVAGGRPIFCGSGIQILQSSRWFVSCRIHLCPRMPRIMPLIGPRTSSFTFLLLYFLHPIDIDSTMAEEHRQHRRGDEIRPATVPRRHRTAPPPSQP